MNRSSGQSLVEYLILLCLISISAIAIVSVVGQNIRAKYASISHAIRGDKNEKAKFEKPDEAAYQLRGMDDFDESAFPAKGGNW